jgi:hypothetical protein
MHIKQKLELLFTYYFATRSVGHTRLLNEGVANYTKDKLVLCSTVQAGDTMRIKRSEILTLEGLHRDTLRGRATPLVVDNSAMMVLLDESIKCIGDLQNQVLELTNDKSNEELKAQLKREINKKKILSSFLKISIADNEEKKKRIEEMERHPLKTFFKSVYGNISKSTSRRPRRNEGRGSKS